jgi:hypothetical protein
MYSSYNNSLERVSSTVPKRRVQTFPCTTTTLLPEVEAFYLWGSGTLGGKGSLTPSKAALRA